eukprot:gene17932-23554_t
MVKTKLENGQIGLLGGIVYISLSVGGPFAGYLLRNYDHQFIVGMSLVTNNVFTFLWALTPFAFICRYGLMNLLLKNRRQAGCHINRLPSH